VPSSSGSSSGRWAGWCSPAARTSPSGPTIAIGIAAALIGSLIASALGVGETRGIDWIKLIIQVALAAAGVALVDGRYAPRRRGL
jgi:hypothetical protein